MGLRRQLGASFLAAAVSFVLACGSDPPPQHLAPPPPPPSPRVLVGLESTSYLIELGESVKVVAHVTGTDTPVTWTLNCETGHASLVASGNSSTVTALSGGTCFLWATEGQVADYAIVRIPPLAAGDSCTEDSQCDQGTPICGGAGGCGKTCTLACTTDADCPIRDAFANHVPCTNHVCRLVRDPDYSCP